MNETVSLADNPVIASGEVGTGTQTAFMAALAARKETFLARLPRKLKLTVTVILMCFWGWALWPQTSTDILPVDHLSTESVDSPSGAGNPPSVKEDTKPAAPFVIPVEPVQLKTDGEKQAAAMNDGTLGTAIVLDPAPDTALIEETQAGRLPRISVDGRKPWQVYARPFNFQDPRPRIAIVMLDMGMSRVATDAALRRLPPAVTFGFDAQAKAVDEWLVRARQDGHETLLSLPMEPFDFPHSDPGPNTLLTSLTNVDNMQRLMAALRLGAGYVGVTTNSGSRFLSDSSKLMPIMQVLKNRGLLVFDTKVASHSVVSSLAIEMGVPSATSIREIDAFPDPNAIDKALASLEQAARLEGSVVAVASPLPVTMERIQAWSKTLAERGFVLAPLSAIVR